MKNKKRAYRRYKKHVILKRRAKNMFSIGKKHTWAEYWEEVKKGNIDCWMRTTGKPCSCWMCSEKYKRPTSEQVRKIIEEGLDE
jgi:hypothetical protein